MLKKSIKITVFLISLLSYYPNPLKAEILDFRNYTMEQGLSNNYVNCGIQDSSGFLWFGTENGLNKYDGNQIVKFQNTTIDSLGLSDQAIRALMLDHNGHIWIGTYWGGLNKFDPYRHTFKRYQNSSENTTISNNRINSIYLDKNNQIWIGTANGLNIYNPKSDNFSRIPSAKNDSIYIQGNRIDYIFQDSFENMWIGTNLGLNKINIKNNKCELYFSDNDKYSIKRTYCIMEDKNHNLWISTYYNGLLKIDPLSMKVKRILPQNYNKQSDPFIVYYTYADKNNRLWIGSRSGLFIYDMEKETLINYNDDNTQLDYRIIMIFKDKIGDMWFCTGNGFSYLSTRPKQFQLLNKDPNKKLSLNHNRVNSIEQTSDDIFWIGTFGGGLNKLDRQKNKITYFTNDPSNPNSISSNNILSLCATNPNTLWIGTYHSGLDRFDISNNKFYHYTANQDDTTRLSTDRIRSIIQTKSGELWVGTYVHLHRYDKKNDCFESHLTEYKNLNIFKIIEDKFGKLWIAVYEKGLFEYDPQTKAVRQFVNNKNDKNSIPSNSILSLCEDHKGNIWIGTHHYGLCCYLRDQGRFITYNDKDGLMNNTIYGILEDENYNLWLSTDDGIIRFDQQNNLFKHFKKIHGLQGHEFNSGSYMKASTGELFFGGTNGLNYFFPNDDSFNQQKPVMCLTGLKIYNNKIYPHETYKDRIVLNQSISELKNLQLSYKDNMFTIYFTVLDFFSPQNNEYAYYLEGLEKDWNYVGTQNWASYAHVKPGQYTLHIKGANGNGQWNEEGITLNIIIPPPFWQTFWFRALVILIIFSVLLTTHKICFLRTKKRNKYLEMMNMELDYQIHEKEQAKADLKKANDELEIKVKDRTVDLKRINNKLEKQIEHHRKTEKALYKSEEKYRILAETATDVILLYDMENNESYINEAGVSLTQYTPEEIKNMDVINLITPENRDKVVKMVTQGFDDNGHGNFKPHLFQTEFINKQGQKIPIEVNASQIKQNNEIKGLLFIARDITERKLVEEKIQNSLTEKEILLKEIHHRVKNNLQIISSLLFLQSQHIKDEKALEGFIDSQNRIKSMSMIHERLYQSENLAVIKFDEYIKGLVKTLMSTYHVDTKSISFKFQLEPISLSINTAIPCGLIVNELVSNAIKHAFPSTNKGCITIGLNKMHKRCEIFVRDNGVGFPENLEVDKTKTLGLFLIEALCEQIDAISERKTENGTSFHISIPFKPN